MVCTRWVPGEHVHSCVRCDVCDERWQVVLGEEITASDVHRGSVMRILRTFVDVLLGTDIGLFLLGFAVSVLVFLALGAL